MSTDNIRLASTRCLTEEDSGLRLTDDVMTVAAQLAHVAQTIEPELPKPRGPGIWGDI